MGENAILLSRPDKKSMRLTLESWFKFHNLNYDENLSTEELRQLYVDIECGKKGEFVSE